MKSLQHSIQDYLAMRRDLGFKLKDAEVHLKKFATFMDVRRTPHITTSLAMEWVQQNTSLTPGTHAQRLRDIRAFAQYHVATDPQTEVPPHGLLLGRQQRARPYLYSDEEISKLLHFALALRPHDGLHRWTYYCLLGLLSVSGMRIGEIINLQLQDANLQDSLLTIHGAKFGKTRLVPLHSSTTGVLVDYLSRRAQVFFGRVTSDYFFVTRTGNHLDIGQIHRTFYKLSQQVGLRAVGASHGPRLHDFRHRFAVQTLRHWYQSGEDPQRRLPTLSTFLGHVHVADTYWYLNACPELMVAAVAKFEQGWERRS